VTDEELEAAQIALARAAVGRFKLSTNVLAFDTTNFDTHIATTTEESLRGVAMPRASAATYGSSGWGCWSAEPATCRCFYRTYAGMGPIQEVLGNCSTDSETCTMRSMQAKGRRRPATRTLVRDGGSGALSWS